MAVMIDLTPYLSIGIIIGFAISFITSPDGLVEIDMLGLLLGKQKILHSII